VTGLYLNRQFGTHKHFQNELEVQHSPVTQLLPDVAATEPVNKFESALG